MITTKETQMKSPALELEPNINDTLNVPFIDKYLQLLHLKPFSILLIE